MRVNRLHRGSKADCFEKAFRGPNWPRGSQVPVKESEEDGVQFFTDTRSPCEFRRGASAHLRSQAVA